MDEQTKLTKDWLDRRFRKEKDGRYFAHQPIYGYDAGHSEPNAIVRLARTFHLIKILESLGPFDSVLDAGAGEGYLGALIRDLFGCQVTTSDLSQEACMRAGSLFHLSSAASDVTRLPFKDKSYDLVICSEVIEHLTKPIFAIGELMRVASRYVVLTTAEFCPLGEWERKLRLGTLDFSYPHAEKNWFTRADLETLLGEHTNFFSQMRNFRGEIFRVFENRNLSRAQVERVLDLLTDSGPMDPNHDGVIAVARLGETGSSSEATDQVSLTVERKNQIMDNILKPRLETDSPMQAEAQFDPALLERLACLACSSSLNLDQDRLVCQGCQQVYEVRGGVPLMFLDSPAAELVENHEKQTIVRLSRGDEVMRRKIEDIVARYHGERYQSPGKYKQALASQSLRLLWFARRGESLGEKLQRVYRRLNKQPSTDYLILQEALSE